MTGFEEAEGILHTYFLPGTKKQIDKEMSPLWKELKPNTNKVEGSEIKFSAQVEDPQGVASRRTHSQILPRAKAGRYIELTVGTGRIYGTLEFDTKMLKAVGTSEVARGKYINFLENEMSGIKNTLVNDLGRQAFGDGRGAISACGVTAGGLIVQLAATANMRLYRRNMDVDIILTATGVTVANGSRREIQAVDVANKRITLDGDGGNVTTDGTHSVTRHGAYNAEMTGLNAVVSDSYDIYGITTTNEREWRSHTTSAS